MNFFGHATVARQIDDDPAFLLGAMAPDLLAMCGAEAGPATSERVAAGQAHHLAVDAAFHASPAFISLQSWSVGTLVAAGLRRGPARGAAHVAVELFLDGALAHDQLAHAAYRRTLATALQMPDPFQWRDTAARACWRQMVLRLHSAAIPHRYRDPAFVAQRLVHALARRPRLALNEAESSILRAFLPSLQQRVSHQASTLVPAL